MVNVLLHRCCAARVDSSRKIRPFWLCKAVYRTKHRRNNKGEKSQDRRGQRGLDPLLAGIRRASKPSGLPGSQPPSWLVSISGLKPERLPRGVINKTTIKGMVRVSICGNPFLHKIIRFRNKQIYSMSDSITTLLRNQNSSSKSSTAVRNFFGQRQDKDDTRITTTARMTAETRQNLRKLTS